MMNHIQVLREVLAGVVKLVARVVVVDPKLKTDPGEFLYQVLFDP
jgi:hypothetical protein